MLLIISPDDSSLLELPQREDVRDADLLAVVADELVVPSGQPHALELLHHLLHGLEGLAHLGLVRGAVAEHGDDVRGLEQ